MTRCCEHIFISTFSLMVYIAVLYSHTVFLVLYIGIKSHFIDRRIGRKYVKVRHGRGRGSNVSVRVRDKKTTNYVFKCNRSYTYAGEKRMKIQFWKISGVENVTSASSDSRAASILLKYSRPQNWWAQFRPPVWLQLPLSIPRDRGRILLRDYI